MACSVACLAAMHWPAGPGRRREEEEGRGARGSPPTSSSFRPTCPRIPARARGRRFVAAELEAVADRPYCLLYVHTRCSYWENSPGVWWLWRTYAGLPQPVRTHMRRLFVLHADGALRLAAAALCPLLAAELWGRVQYVPRAEFLPPSLLVRGKRLRLLPGCLCSSEPGLQTSRLGARHASLPCLPCVY